MRLSRLKSYLPWLLLWGSAVCSAQTAPDSGVVSEERYREVAGNYRCPTCTGLSVLESDAPFSVQIQDRVKEMLGEGKSPEEIEKFFVSKYGPWILRAPPKEGFGLMACVLPFIFLAVGFGFLMTVFLQKRRQTTAAVGDEDSTRQDILNQFDRFVARSVGES